MPFINVNKPIDTSPEAVARFWSHVLILGTDECWPWQLALNPKGYGQFSGYTGGKQWMCIASRYAYLATHDWPKTTLLVLHSCDNPACCNPAHLRLGTVADNSADMTSRGRQSRGSHRAQSKLTEGNIELLHAMWLSGAYSQYELADQFGVNQSQISRAINRRRWQHVETKQPPKPARKKLPPRVVTFRGETKRLTQFIKELGLNWHCVDRRLRCYGWTVDEALSTPIGGARSPRKKAA